jgi:hypothetical protein
MTAPTSFILGLDPGQAQDPSALAALERTRGQGGDVYAVVGLKRWPLGTPYTDPPAGGVCEQAGALLAAPPLGGQSGTILAVDYTGVGRGVVDVLAALGLPAALVPVTITAGHQATRQDDGGWPGWHVPKKELVSTLLLLLGQGRLLIREGQALAQALRQELADFRVKVTRAAHETFNAREGSHDDLVLAVAVAAWVAERHPAFTREALGRGGPRPVAGVAAGDFRHWPQGG